ncbi:hypothetical protein [Streptomyces sp. NPDC002540]
MIVLAVIGTVLALTLGGGDKDNQGGAGGKDDKSTSAGASPKGSATETDSGSGKAQDQGGDQSQGKDQDQGKGKGDDSGKGSDGSKDDPGAKGDALPAGYGTITNKQFHFTIAMPEDFRLDHTSGQNSGGIFNADGGFPRVQVDYTDSPGDDAAAAWNAAKGGVEASSNGYRHLGVKKVQYNGYPTVADWQFERTQQGQRVRVLNRGFKVDGSHGYAIMISCRSSEWDGKECRTLRRTAFDTFEPTD